MLIIKVTRNEMTNCKKVRESWLFVKLFCIYLLRRIIYLESIFPTPNDLISLMLKNGRMISRCFLFYF